MIQFMKQNKIFSILIILSIITFIAGLLLPAVISKNEKEIIKNNLLELKEQINHQQSKQTPILKQKVLSNGISIATIWILGISIIGIPIIIIFYLEKVLILSLELSFMIINRGEVPLFSIPFYCFPNIVNTILFFFLTYYAIHYSILLIKVLFFQKQYNIRIITKRYSRVLLGIVGLSMINLLIEIYLVPKILKFFY